ncbi:hypothetical protein [Caldicellulosiruptor acetigenus]|uniref:hypothetical protein n=1 Tax=Caldicellulosiruptor acetigenus TaxID=301953 RepID=UPI0001E991E8|nr:hypothetical protein [Caldicellulosiruptor acetigenus]
MVAGIFITLFSINDFCYYFITIKFFKSTILKHVDSVKRNAKINCALRKLLEDLLDWLVMFERKNICYKKVI